METIEQSVEIDLPVRTVYNQWTQFEEFPEFMQGVEEVRQLDDKRLHWKANIAGKAEEWDAEIFDQVPDQRICWRSITGAKNSGIVSFISSGLDKTRITLRLEYEPMTMTEKIGDALGLVSRRVEGDLQRFKEFIESRGAETGAWRAEIRGSGTAGDRTTATELTVEPRSKRLHDS